MGAPLLDTYLKFETMSLDWSDFEDRQRLDELLRLLSEDFTSLQVPGSTFQEQAMSKATWKHPGVQLVRIQCKYDMSTPPSHNGDHKRHRV